MAQPYGSITETELSYPVTSVTEYICHGYRFPQAVLGLGWTELRRRLRVRWKSCVTVVAGNTIHLQYHATSTAKELRTGPLTLEWSAAWVPVDGIFLGEILSDTPPMGVPPHLAEQGTDPLSRIREIAVYANAYERGTIHEIAVELCHGDPTAGEVEEMQRDGAAGCLYLPNMPVSSWQMRDLTVAAYNYLLNQNRLVLSIPLLRGMNVS